MKKRKRQMPTPERAACSADSVHGIETEQELTPDEDSGGEHKFWRIDQMEKGNRKYGRDENRTGVCSRVVFETIRQLRIKSYDSTWEYL